MSDVTAAFRELHREFLALVTPPLTPTLDWLSRLPKRSQTK